MYRKYTFDSDASSALRANAMKTNMRNRDNIAFICVFGEATVFL